MKKDIKQEAAKEHDPVKEAAKQNPKVSDPYDTRVICPDTPRCVVLDDSLNEGRA